MPPISHHTDNSVQAIRDLLKKANQTIIITTHKNPDADALGSSLAMAKFLKTKGHTVHVIIPNQYPQFLAWMLEQEKVHIFEEDNQDLLKQYIKQANIIFCLDFHHTSRLSALGPIIEHATATKVLIDHHINPSDFAKIIISDTQACSTALLIYKLLRDLKEIASITPSIANCLYAGIAMDTGSFQHNNTNAEAHYIAGELLTKGVNIALITEHLYQSHSLNKLKFLAHAITNRFTIVPEIKFAYFTIPQKDFLTFELKPGDTKGIVHYALSLHDINCAALLTQHTDHTRISLRSKSSINVHNIAKKHFKGGGHKNASGGISYLSLIATAKKLVTILQKDE